MISYETTKSKQHHVLTETDARKALAPVLAFLRRCTDCVGPLRADGVTDEQRERLLEPHRRRVARQPFDVDLDALTSLETIVGELALARLRARDDHRHGRPGDDDDDCEVGSEPLRFELAFMFGLVDPQTRAPVWPDVPYANPNSFLYLELRHELTSELAMALHWPCTDASPEFLRLFDAAFETLQVLPKSEVMTKDYLPWSFDRGAHEPPPGDPTGRALHDAVLAAPDDDGARTAYADWLTSRGDPLGEAMAIQLELARRPVPHRASKLRMRLRELRRAHGLRWSRVLVPD